MMVGGLPDLYCFTRSLMKSRYSPLEKPDKTRTSRSNWLSSIWWSRWYVSHNFKTAPITKPRLASPDFRSFSAEDIFPLMAFSYLLIIVVVLPFSSWRSRSRPPRPFSTLKRMAIKIINLVRGLRLLNLLRHACCQIAYHHHEHREAITAVSQLLTLFVDGLIA